MTIANSNTQFILSGLGLAAYQFLQNPEQMNIIPPQQKFNVLKTIEANDIYQQQFVDNEIRTMDWSRTSQSNYANLKTFATRDSNGILSGIYFWDGTVKEFQGIRIKVFDVVGEPIVAQGTLSQEYWKVRLIYGLSPVGNMDGIYKINFVDGYQG